MKIIYEYSLFYFNLRDKILLRLQGKLNLSRRIMNLKFTVVNVKFRLMQHQLQCLKLYYKIFQRQFF